MSLASLYWNALHSGTESHASAHKPNWEFLALAVIQPPGRASCSLFSPGHSPALFSLLYKNTGIKQLDSSRVPSPDPREWETLGLWEHLQTNVSEGQGTSKSTCQKQASFCHHFEKGPSPWKASHLLLFRGISYTDLCHMCFKEAEQTATAWAHFKGSQTVELGPAGTLKRLLYWRRAKNKV